ncbi:MAG: DUF1320 domain-containing protein [Ignavibacteria bacterium]|nr:DUF1320 domain-containing protein [Ignavibacteria bacterium]
MYTTLAELLKEFKPEELARLTGDSSGGNIDQVRVNYAIENSCNLIDSFLRDRFSVPFSSVPSLIRFIARELTIANLYEYSNHNGFVPPTIAKRKSYAMYLLRQIQSGDLQLDLPETENRQVLLSNKVNQYRLFDNFMLDKFVEM